MFKLDLLPRFDDVEEYVVPGKKGRHYKTRDGIFPSVTTVLASHYNKDQVLQPWKDKVGVVKATRILMNANDRGTRIHNLAEKYVLNQDYQTGEKSLDLMQFRRLKKYLDAHVTTIYGTEFPLFSSTLQTAGKTDLIALWDGEPAIIDYKTSLKPKKESWIENYFVQAATYSRMVNELFSLDIKTFVVMIAVDLLPPQLFVKKVADYQDLVENIFINKRVSNE